MRNLEAHELRLGNYVTPFKNIEMPLSKLALVGIMLGEINYQPIPLTEEWLLKFGFEKSDNEFYTEIFKGDNKSDYYLCIRINDNLSDLVICERVDESNYCSLIVPKYIQHVHQLQNLYFTLTNEELTL